MKFILFSIKDTNKSVELNRIDVLKDKTLDEIVLSKDKINKIVKIKIKTKKNLLDKIALKIYENNLKSKIFNKENKNNKDIKYLFSKDVNPTDRNTKYLISLLENIGLKEFSMLNEMDTNFSRYIEEYVEKNKMNIHDTRMLFVYTNIKNINFDAVLNAVKMYREVNIYLKESVTKEVINNIERINEQEGSVIEVIKYNKKAFLDYDVIYYADDYRANYPRMRLNKKSLVLDNETAFTDKFNSNIIFFNKLNDKANEMKDLEARYGLLNISSVLRHM